MANYGASTVTKINLSTFLTVGSALAVGSNPYSIAIDPAGTYAYMANYSGSTVTKINLSTFLTVGSALAVGSTRTASPSTHRHVRLYGKLRRQLCHQDQPVYVPTVGSALTVGSNPYSIAIDPPALTPMWRTTAAALSPRSTCLRSSRSGLR